jgi:hypothetical protein
MGQGGKLSKGFCKNTYRKCRNIKRTTRSAPVKSLDACLEAGLVSVICGLQPQISIDTPTSKRWVSFISIQQFLTSFAASTAIIGYNEFRKQVRFRVREAKICI